MNLKKTINMLTVLITLITLPQALYAQETTGGIDLPPTDTPTTQGPGQGTRINGKLHLMDTVEGLSRSARCVYTPLKDVMAGYPEAQAVLSKLSEVHAYAAQAFVNEAERIRVCMAGKLRVPKKSGRSEYRSEAIFLRYTKRLETIGYRWGQKLLVDQVKLNELSKVDQAMFWIHEIGHSFVPQASFVSGGAITQTADDPVPTVFTEADARVFSRIDRLWSFVYSIYLNYKTGITGPAFAEAIVQNGVTLPDTDVFWEKSPQAYQLAFSREAQTKDRIVAISKIKWSDVQSFIIDRDREQLEHFLMTWYTPAIDILKNRPYGWQVALESQLQTYGLDPFQRLPNGESLLTLAVKQQESRAVSILLSYPIRSQDRAIQVQFFEALLAGQIPDVNLSSVLAHFDPNEGEMLETIENGIQRYRGEVPFFIMAIEADRMDIAGIFLNSNRVKLETVAMGASALMKFDMGTSTMLLNPTQKMRREFFDRLLLIDGFQPSADDLSVAIVAQNEYAAGQLLDRLTPSVNEVSKLIRSQWVQTRGGRSILAKALARPGVDVNAQDQSGYTMVDYALTLRNSSLQLAQEIFDLLIQSGANQFKKNLDYDERDWIMTRLIDLDAGMTLKSYLVQVELRDQLYLYNMKDFAKIRGKTNAAAVLDARIQELVHE